MYSNTTADGNTAVGFEAALNNTTAELNSALGFNALRTNTTGGNNVALGTSALYSNTTASNNTGLGYRAGFSNTTGTLNTFVGNDSGYAMTTGSKNTILGRYNGNSNGLDIRGADNNIVLSDGDGVPRGYYWSDSGETAWFFTSPKTNQLAMKVINSASSVPYGLAVMYTGSAPNNTSSTVYYFSDTGGNKFSVYSNGNVVNQNNSYGAISDVKLKENIIDASSQWDDIKNLTVRKYSLKSDNLDAPNMLGVIAQEVEAAGMGGLVYESPDQDAEMNDLGTVTKQVNYSILYMKAVKALQEAMTRIETLESKVAVLEG